jgi:hypoxanthine phosphoribosyltransferase
MMETLTIIFGLASVASILVAIYYSRKNAKLIKTRYRYSWTDIHQGVWGLLEMIRKRGITPEIVVTVTGSGAVVANLFTKLYGRRLPSYHVMLEDPDDPWGYTPKGHLRREPGRWVIHIPEAILGEPRDKSVLVLDSSFFNGYTIKAVRDFLVSNGFKSVTVACLLRVDPPPAGAVAFLPEIDYYKNPANEFYYPWGRG